MRIAVPAWLVILLAVSLAPLSVKYQLHSIGSLHYAAHFVSFILTALLFCWKPVRFRSKLISALAACFAATVLEGLEAGFYRNSVEWLDVWTGCLGVAAGLILTTILQGAFASPQSYENKD